MYKHKSQLTVKFRMDSFKNGHICKPAENTEIAWNLALDFTSVSCFGIVFHVYIYVLLSYTRSPYKMYVS